MKKDCVNHGAFHHLFTLIVVAFSLCFCAASASSQNRVKAYLNQTINTANEYARNAAFEKLYVHTDKPSYAAGDTLWFKAYLLNALTLAASEKTGILYLELANDSNRLVKRIMLPVYSGFTFGNIALDSELFPQGGYTLRCYSNWMRNFGEAQVFKKHFYISNPTNQTWLISYHTQAANKPDNTVQLNLQVSQLDKVPVAVREMQMQLTDGKRTWAKHNLQTNLSGNIQTSLELPDKADNKHLSLILTDLRKGEGNRRLAFPLILNRPDYIDLQLMPEGGKLIAGLPACVAFKALNEGGLSTPVSGGVYNTKNQLVTELISSHKGMGTFSISPVAGETYQVKLRLPEGSYKTFPFPPVEQSGVSLHVNNPYNTDSCEVEITATADLIAAGTPIYLFAGLKGLTCYGALVKLMSVPNRIKLSKGIFPTGIIHFILTNSNNQPLSERIAYIDHKDKLKISVATDKAAYKRRDSIILQVLATNATGIPVQGTFSVSITDDGQVKRDTLTEENINSYFHLSSELMGHIEDPGYYNQAVNNPEKWKQLDELLLAQGWRDYNWTDLFKPSNFTLFEPEHEFLIKGKVTNIFNKGVAKSGVTLYSSRPFMLIDTITNDKGEFTFKDVFPADTAVYFIQAKNKRGKSNNVGIDMREFIPPVFNPLNEVLKPWYMNIDTVDYASAKRGLYLKNEQQRIYSGNLLRAVEIKGKRIIKASKNLNGPGEADVIIDQDELEKSARKSLEQLLKLKVKGFGVRFDKGGIPDYKIYTTTVHLIIDGIELDFFYDGLMSRYQFYKQYMDYYDAEEIKGIEVMTSGKYQSTYFSRFNKNPLDSPWDHSYIEVTTRSGAGPFLKKAIGTYVYRPMPYSTPKAFYSPKYKVNAKVDMTDIRSTIYWEAHLVTDKEGKGTIKFFTSDNAGFYTCIIEGGDMDGSIGTGSTRLLVKDK